MLHSLTLTLIFKIKHILCKHLPLKCAKRGVIPGRYCLESRGPCRGVALFYFRYYTWMNSGGVVWRASAIKLFWYKITKVKWTFGFEMIMCWIMCSFLLAILRRLAVSSKFAFVADAAVVMMVRSFDEISHHRAIGSVIVVAALPSGWTCLSCGR